MRLANKRNLEKSDVYENLPTDRSEHLHNRINRFWEKEVDVARTKDKDPRLLTCLLKVFWKEIVMTGLLLVLSEFFKVSSPILIGRLMTYFEGDISRSEAWVYGGIIIGFSFLVSYPWLHYFHIMLLVTSQMRIACSAAIFRKILKLNSQFLSAGKITNLLSTDIEKFRLGIQDIHFFWLAPLECGLIMYLLYRDIGWVFLPCVIFVVVFVPVEMALGRLFGRLRYIIATWTDERINTMSEVLSGMRVIKMYVWEPIFRKLVTTMRRNEMRYTRFGGLIRGQNTSFYFISSKLMSYVVMMNLALTGRVITLQLIVKMITWLEVIKTNMFLFIPDGVQYLTELLTSTGRIADFLMLDENDENYSDEKPDKQEKVSTTTHTKKTSSDMHTILEDEEGDDSAAAAARREPVIKLDGVTALWEQLEPDNDDAQNGVGEEKQRAEMMDSYEEVYGIKNMTMEIRPGQLVAVVGPVGSGKSSLLLALLKELPVMSGTLSVGGSVSYTPQQAWVFAGTVRENILFGQPMERERYKRVIKASALERDVDLMASGDLTQTGERGMNLSGGQQARVNLARALYRDADVYLLDDPLSAVDAKVAKHLFDKCFRQYLAGKTRILVTHQVQFLHRCDQIFVLQNGTVTKQGKFHEVSSVVSSSAVMEEDVEARTEKRRQSEMRRISRSVAPPTTGRPSVMGGRPSVMGGWARTRKESAMSWGSKSSTASNISKRSRRESQFRKDSTDSVAMMRKVSDVAGIRKESLLAVPELLDSGEEEVQEGSVGFRVYLDYYKAGKGYIFLTLFFILSIVTQVSYIMSDWFLTFWAKENQAHYGGNVTDSALNVVVPEAPFLMRNVIIYSSIIGAMVVANVLRSVMFALFTSLASTALHNNMFTALLRAPMTFFDANPVGRILNRCSRDVGFIDDNLPTTLFIVFLTVFEFLGTFVVISYSSPYTMIACVPLLAGVGYVRHFALKAIRGLKRIEAVKKSPMYSHISTCIEGMEVIRTCNMQQEMIAKFDNLQDGHSSAYRLFWCAYRWTMLRMDWMTSTYYSVCIVVALVLPLDEGNIGTMGLALSYGMLLVRTFQYTAQMTAEAESLMTSVERIQEYANVKPEAEEHTRVVPPDEWPDEGEVRMTDVKLRYTETGPYILKGLTVRIQGNEKVGIVGRTGAGKSTVFATLMRLAEPEGTIIIDDVDITQIGLVDLRSKVSVIPQEPVLFSGSLRKNLDPFNDHVDKDIYKALDQVQLKDKVFAMPGGLYTEMDNSGGYFSVGQKQLVCLARAILRCSKILIIDEATANVDNDTDAIIQNAIRENFKSCTVLTIAHRLQTVIDSDKMLVLEAGKAKEFDDPWSLLQDESTVFSQMVQETGPKQAAHLKNLAERQARLRKARQPRNNEDWFAEEEEEHASEDNTQQEEDNANKIVEETKC